MLSCHLAYFIALPDACVSRVPLIPLCMPLWQGTCSAQLFIVIGLSGCSISIIKEQATDSLALVPVPPSAASPSDHLRQMFHGSVTRLVFWEGGVLTLVDCLSVNLWTDAKTFFYKITLWAVLNSVLLRFREQSPHSIKRYVLRFLIQYNWGWVWSHNTFQ